MGVKHAVGIGGQTGGGNRGRTGGGKRGTNRR